MSFDRYWQEHMRGVEENRERVDRTWLAILFLLRAREKWWRQSVYQHVLGLPLTDQGRFDVRPGTRNVFAAFRGRVTRDTETLIRTIHRDLVGTTDPFRFQRKDGPRRGPTSGRMPKALSGALRDFDSRWMKVRDIEEADRLQITQLRDQKKVVERKLPPQERKILQSIDPIEPPVDDPVGDLWDIQVDNEDNIPRNLNYHAFKGPEEVTRAVNKNTSPEEVRNLLLGPMTREPSLREADEVKGVWHLHRGDMKLSTVAHIPAMHRRRAVTCGLRDGHQLFRLDIAQRDLTRLRARPGGRIAQHAWKIRPLSEWHRITAAINRDRRTSSGIDTLGMGYGDYSYVTPIPTIYLRQAFKQGVRFRKRWLGAAALVLATNDKGAA